MTIRRINLSRRVARCPLCGLESKRHCNSRRTLREIGIARPVVIEVKYSKHLCERCEMYFSVDMSDLAPKTGRFTNRVRRSAVEMVIGGRLKLQAASIRMRQKYFVDVPVSTLHDWVRNSVVL